MTYYPATPAEPWPRFGPVLSPELRQALRNPDLAPSHPLYTYRFGRRRKKPISLRMDPWILDLVKAMALQHRRPYQQVLRKLIEEGLARAMREGLEELQGLPD